MENNHTESVATESVSSEEIKAFMNEPEATEEKPAPQPMGMDDWQGTAENAVNDFKLTGEEIAAIAFSASSSVEYILKIGPLTAWELLTPEVRQYYIGIVNFFINGAANPNGHEACQALHDLVLDAKLRDGWTHGEEYSETEKKDPMLLSYKGLPPHLKARNFLFRCVVVGLVAIWKGH